MAAIINALDNYTSKQIGEKGHVEYGWSNSIQEKILQFSFQLTRTNKHGVEKLKLVLRELLSNLKYQYQSATTIAEKEISKGYLSMLYRMIGHTRDIIEGKGEYALTYMMIYTWYEFFPELSRFALQCLIRHGADDTIHPYGSWKDMKYFCSYCKSQEGNEYHDLIQDSIAIMNEQIRKDYSHFLSNDMKKITLSGKWLPREKSTFGWLFCLLAHHYFPEYLQTAHSPEQLVRASLKCKMEYRHILSALNKQIDTLQIKQCGKIWSEINFDHVTSISMSKQKKAFLNKKKNGEIKYPEDPDRIQCADNFKTFLGAIQKGEKEVKGKRVGMDNFTKQALELLENGCVHANQLEIDLLNSQWRDNATQNGKLGDMIAMVDVSGSMYHDTGPIYPAISLGLRIAEKSRLGKRVLTFSSDSDWFNLEAYPEFVDQVRELKKANWGMTTNFYGALDKILDAIIENKLSPEEVENLSLVILSDMQIDDAYSSDHRSPHVQETMYKKIEEKYADAGIRLYGKPFKPPHIIFWNLSSSTGFPNLSTQKNTSMISGYSPVLLNLFCEKGIESFHSITPWTILENMLNNERYKIMSNRLEIVLV
jgi:hypothetical protein